jgi:hypothetical protein
MTMAIRSRPGREREGPREHLIEHHAHAVHVGRRRRSAPRGIAPAPCRRGCPGCPHRW